MKMPGADMGADGARSMGGKGGAPGYPPAPLSARWYATELQHSMSDVERHVIGLMESARALTTMGDLLVVSVERERAEVLETLREALASDSAVMAVKVALLIQRLEGKA